MLLPCCCVIQVEKYEGADEAGAEIEYEVVVGRLEVDDCTIGVTRIYGIANDEVQLHCSPVICDVSLLSTATAKNRHPLSGIPEAPKHLKRNASNIRLAIIGSPNYSFGGHLPRSENTGRYMGRIQPQLSRDRSGIWYGNFCGFSGSQYPVPDQCT